MRKVKIGEISQAMSGSILAGVILGPEALPGFIFFTDVRSFSIPSLDNLYQAWTDKVNGQDMACLPHLFWCRLIHTRQGKRPGLRASCLFP